MHFELADFYFVLIQLELKRLVRSYTPVVPSKTIPYSRPKWAKCIPVFRSDQKGPRTLRIGVAHIYIAYIRE